MLHLTACACMWLSSWHMLMAPVVSICTSADASSALSKLTWAVVGLVAGWEEVGFVVGYSSSLLLEAKIGLPCPGADVLHLAACACVWLSRWHMLTPPFVSICTTADASSALSKLTWAVVGPVVDWEVVGSVAGWITTRLSDTADDSCVYAKVWCS